MDTVRNSKIHLIGHEWAIDLLNGSNKTGGASSVAVDRPS
jgi:hypothetical protein